MELLVSVSATLLKNWLRLPLPNTMNLPFETISIVGLGYIGLPTAAVFASRKVKVIGVDVNQHAVDTINRGQIHIVEPDLDMVVHAAVSEGYLRATTKPEPADAFLIAVPTPFKDGPTGPHHPDMDYIESASKSVAVVLKAGDLVILESTSPVGATEQMAAWLAQARPDLTFPQTHGEASDIRIAHCPERVLPGQVLRELVQNDRVIGGMTPKCSDAATRLYKIFVQGECVITNARTAEMCKLTENSFRDVNIAFANELSIVCDKLDINVWELIKLANRHPRVNILQPGPGVGGHCIAVDPWFIVSQSPDQARLIRCAREVNDSKPAWVVDKVKTAANALATSSPKRKLDSLKISCLGLSFKANIDDTRESPALDIVRTLAREYPGQVLVAEPHLSSLPPSLHDERVTLVPTDEAIDRADVIVMLVDHTSFKQITPANIGNRALVDTRGLWQTNGN
jgi:UDP-N-acetyl-D-mannosaminuronic acid dehydrogenase